MINTRFIIVVSLETSKEVRAAAILDRRF